MNASGDMTLEQAYVVLGLSSGASDADIERAFRLRSRMMHPDRFVSSPESEVRLATAEFRRVTDARATLLAGRKHRRQDDPMPERGADAEVSALLEPSVASRGGTVTVTTPQGDSVRVRVPPQTKAGARLRVKGHGRRGVHGGESGNLIVFITLRASEEVPNARRENKKEEDARDPYEFTGRDNFARPSVPVADETHLRRRGRRWPWLVGSLVLVGAAIGLSAMSTSLNNVAGSIGFTEVEADDVPCDANETNGCWAWRIVPETDCERGLATVALSPTSRGTSTMISQNVLTDLQRGVPRVFTTASPIDGLKFAHIESIACMP